MSVPLYQGLQTLGFLGVVSVPVSVPVRSKCTTRTQEQRTERSEQSNYCFAELDRGRQRSTMAAWPESSGCITPVSFTTTGVTVATTVAIRTGTRFQQLRGPAIG